MSWNEIRTPKMTPAEWWDTDLPSGAMLFSPNLIDLGYGYDHDMPCAVFHSGKKREPAVLNTNVGVFEPSWVAQQNGWHLIHANTPFKRWLFRTFFRIV